MGYLLFNLDLEFYLKVLDKVMIEDILTTACSKLSSINFSLNSGMFTKWIDFSKYLESLAKTLDKLLQNISVVKGMNGAIIITVFNNTLNNTFKAIYYYSNPSSPLILGLFNLIQVLVRSSKKCNNLGTTVYNLQCFISSLKNLIKFQLAAMIHLSITLDKLATFSDNYSSNQKFFSVSNSYLVIFWNKNL